VHVKGGLALLLGKGPPPKGGAPMTEEDAEESPDSEGSDEVRQYAQHFVDAMADGDKPGATDALVALMACK